MKNEVFEYLVKAYRENRLSHAFLLETNNQEQTTNEIIQFVNYINCPKDFKEGCFECEICSLNEKKLLPNLVIIEPEGQYIKKEQIEGVVQRFSTTSFLAKNNVFIIKNTEKLNASSGNMLLKFIEEPFEKTYAFLITSDREAVLSTIKSRCQVMKEIGSDDPFLSLEIPKDMHEIMINDIREVGNYLVNNKNKLPMVNILLQKHYPDLKSMEVFFTILRKVLEATLNKTLFLSYNSLFVDLVSCFEKFTNDDLLKYLLTINEIIERMRYNVDSNLLLDYWAEKMVN